MCIATGGGVVTVPGNFEILKKMGFIVYLKRDLDKLSVKGRPLSAGKGVERLFEERSVFYESWCDRSVENKTIPETVSRIMQMYCEK
jgi:shikimate dehydrogenase